jgi:hypothetical protein
MQAMFVVYKTSHTKTYHSFSKVLTPCFAVALQTQEGEFYPPLPRLWRMIQVTEFYRKINRNPPKLKLKKP